MIGQLFMIVFAMLLVVPSTAAALAVGDQAPGFEAQSTHGNIILSEYQGRKRVVLALYYADFTPV